MKRKKMQIPHDSVFKQFLSHTDTARDFLDIHLPPALRAVCDLSTLTLESGSFIEADLRPHYSDILYSLKTTQGDGYIYAVIEHQSTPDKLMAFRLLRYSLSAMQRHLEQGHKHLPLVIPVLFYHGKIRPYPYSTCWFDCFAAPSLARELYSSAFPLVDVTAIPDDEILTHRRVALLELVQKHIRQRDMAEFLQELALLLAYDYTTDEQLKSVLNYLLLAGDTADPEGFIRQLAEQSPKYEEVLMTIAQKLEQKGLERGLEKGRMEGKLEGKVEGKLEVARAMLSSGMERDTVMELSGLTLIELAQISH